eukprot:12886832-Alexandrium_andersonii.AAC.1
MAAWWALAASTSRPCMLVALLRAAPGATPGPFAGTPSAGARSGTGTRPTLAPPAQRLAAP